MIKKIAHCPSSHQNHTDPSKNKKIKKYHKLKKAQKKIAGSSREAPQLSSNQSSKTNKPSPILELFKTAKTTQSPLALESTLKTKTRNSIVIESNQNIMNHNLKSLSTQKSIKKTLLKSNKSPMLSTYSKPNNSSSPPQKRYPRQ